MSSSSEEAKSFKGGKEAKRARRLKWITEADAEHLLSFKQSNCNVGFSLNRNPHPRLNETLKLGVLLADEHTHI